MKDCIFCKIVKKEIKSDIIYEDENFIIINDINPMTTKHYLAIPKIHYADITELNDNKSQTLAQILQKIGKLANDVLKLEDGFRIVINKGKYGCQSVYHLHIHLLGGEQLSAKFN